MIVLARWIRVCLLRANSDESDKVRLIPFLVWVLGTTSCTWSWEMIQPEGGGFAVSMPQAEENTQEFDTPFGSTEKHSWSNTETGLFRNQYLVQYGDLVIPAETEPRDVLRQLREWIADGYPGSVQALQSLTVEGGDGVAFEVHADEGFLFRVRIYLVEGRYFHLSVGQIEEGILRRWYGDRFFESFQLTP